MKGIARTAWGLRSVVAIAMAVGVWGTNASSQGVARVRSSLLLLIDASGSMGEEIGGGSPQIKIDAAKEAAIAALGRAARGGAVEVAVLAFSGDCQDPVPSYQPFTSDVGQLTFFINGLEPGGGTPMADAVLYANRYMAHNADRRASQQMIMLLADGQNDCGDIGRAIAELRASGTIFRHETIGFGIAPNSQASSDLRHIATQTGGAYHHAVDAKQLTDVFMEFVDTFTVIDMLGSFSSGGPTSVAPSETIGKVDGAQPPDRRRMLQGASNKEETSSLTGMLGQFRKESRSGTVEGEHSAMWGALAIDSNQGPSWGWAVDYATLQGAEQRALTECGEKCHVVMRFGGECAAFAADQDQGSTIHGWANGSDNGPAAQTRALDECARRGGTSCVIRAWGCTSQ